MKDIVIVANFVGALDGGKNSRFTYLAEKINSEEDVSVEIISSSFSHDNKRKRNSLPDVFKFKVTLINEPGYRKNVCIKRFYSHYIWGKNVIKYLRNRKKPDVVYCAVPSLTGPNEVAKYCEKNKIPFIIDIQDLWPEAFQMVFNIPVFSNVIFKPFEKMADSIYKSADKVVAVSKTYVDRALEKNKATNGYSVFLGTDLGTFDKNSQKIIVKSLDLEKKEKEVIVLSSLPEYFEKGKDEIWLAYCGTLGSSYDLTTAIHAISKLNDSPYKITFMIMGSGPKEKEFIDCANKMKINAIFTGNLPYTDMCSILVNCDININPITAGAAQSIINKHADYAASGLPVISTQESEEYRNLVELYNMGFNCDNNDVEDLYEKIMTLVSNPELRAIQGKNARKCAEEKFDRSQTYAEIVKIIMDSIKRRQND